MDTMKTARARSGVMFVMGVSVVMALTGCSWLTLRSPPTSVTDTARPCTEDADAPWVDTAGAVGTSISLLAFVPLSDLCDDAECDEFLPVGVITAGLAVAFILSSRYGYRMLEACRRFNAGEVTVPSVDPAKPAPVAKPALSARPAGDSAFMTD